MICPDFKKGGKNSFNIKGDPSTNQQEMMVFNVKKCSKEPGDTKDCPDDVDEWIKDVSVEIWTIHEKIFFD